MKEKQFKPVVGVPFNDRAEEAQRKSFDTEEAVQAFLKDHYAGGSVFGIDNLLQSGEYRLMAFRYNFRPYLKKWLVLSNGHYQHYYAPNKTSLRRAAYLPREVAIWAFPETEVSGAV